VYQRFRFLGRLLHPIWILALVAGCPAPDPTTNPPADFSVAPPDLDMTSPAPDDLTSPPPPEGDLRPAPLPLASLCHHDADCESGVCVDGVCCDRACSGCMACNLPGSVGTCQAVSDGADPHGVCTQACAAGCHAGSCAPAPAGTLCKRSCSDAATSSTLTAQACSGSSLDCNGAASSATCGEYACASGTLCGVSCAADGDCIHGYYCKAQQCVPAQANGAACNRPAQCASNVCNGVCQECVYNYQCTSSFAPQCNGGTCGNCSAGFSGRGTCYSGGEVECTMSSQCLRAFGPICNQPYGNYDCGCGKYAWCPPGTFCSGTDANATCLVQAGQPCHSNDQCIGGACVNRVCATHAPGQACLTGQDCKSGVCNSDETCQ
jgi:hypothetical protein